MVIVNPGEDLHKKRAEHASFTSDWCMNSIATQKWFVCWIPLFDATNI